MGFLPPLFLSLLALCITPSGESNIFSVAIQWYANARCTIHDPISPGSRVASTFPRQVPLSRVIYERSKPLCPQGRSDIKSATVFILARSFIIKRLSSP